MRTLIFIICFCSLLTTSCSKSPENQPPSSVSLTFPTANLLCTDNRINFQWSTSVDPEGDAVRYNIVIAKDRALTDIVENRNISASELLIILEKNVAYYWQVTPVDANDNSGDPSDTFAFFTKGDGTNNTVPFTAATISPKNNDAVDAGDINLNWSGADSNPSDTLTYEVFFGEAENPPSVESNLSVESYMVTVSSGKTYYWKVNTTDNSGAKSIGQIVRFTVN